MYERSTSSEEKFRHLNGTLSFFEADLAVSLMWGLQERVNVTVIPSMFIEVRGGITALSKLVGVFDSEIGRNWVLEALN